MPAYVSVASAGLGNVAASVASVTVFNANAKARGRSIQNDSTATLYLKYGISAGLTSHSVQIGPGQLYEFPQPLYLGRVDGVWSAADGFARITEW